MTTNAMPLRPEKRQPESLGALALFAGIDRGNDAGDIPLEDRIGPTLEKVSKGLESALGSRATVHGWHAQSMFEWVVVALGSITVLSMEDDGSCFFNDDEGSLKRPDFRIVTESREHLLVEVKNVSPKQIKSKRSFSMPASEMDELNRYSELTGGRLVIANYWSSLNLWTLVAPGSFDRHGDKVKLELTTAMMQNEMSLLGDSWIGTEPPLALVLRSSEPTKGTEVSPDSMNYNFKIGEAFVECAGKRVSDSVEEAIAWQLMCFGKWNCEKRAEQTAAMDITGIRFEWRPEVDENDGMAIAGVLSSMASAQFAFVTTDREGEINAVSANPVPARFGSLIPSDYWTRPNRVLKLWRLELQPEVPAS